MLPSEDLLEALFGFKFNYEKIVLPCNHTLSTSALTIAQKLAFLQKDSDYVTECAVCGKHCTMADCRKYDNIDKIIEGG